MSNDHENFARLPTNVIPNHYLLKIVPNFDTFKFSGQVTISVDVEEKTSKIILNAVDILIQSASFMSNGQG